MKIGALVGNSGFQQKIPFYLVIVIGFGAFVAGFIAHQQALHNYARPMVSYLLGDTGGCGVSSAYSVVTTGPRLGAARSTLHRSSHLLEESGDGLQKWKTPLGVFWWPRNTHGLLVLAEQMIRIYEDDKHGVRQGDVVLDCGANIGAFTRRALAAGARLVVGIEPVPSNIECLRRTFQSEIADGRVIIVPKGVWDQEDILEMNLYDNSALDSFVLAERWEEPETRTPRKVKLPVTTVDQIVRELQLSRVDFIKMDIEGAERKALLGSRQTIAKFRPRMSIATENLPDDYRVVPEVVNRIATNYESLCGVCRVVGTFTIRPDVVYFIP